MPDELLTPSGPYREALLDAIEARLKVFDCYLMTDPTDDARWQVVDVTSQAVVIAEITDLEAFARANGIALPR